MLRLKEGCLAMCGICGYIDYKRDVSNETKIIESMTETLKYRGPDSHGYYINKNIMLGQRRLVVVDPEGGYQPMIKSINGNKYVLVYNGELYNTEDLRKELLTFGYKFDAYSDTEVLLVSYIHWGIDCVNHINGIFAFAVYDENEKSLFLVRDPLGVKPLFYTFNNSTLIFGSEVKTLLAHPKVDAILDKEGLTELFALGPATSLGSGVLKGIKEIPPAHYIYIKEDKFTLKEYWTVTAEPFNETLDEATDHLRELLIDAITRQLVGDVPVCTFLSGGLDSSAISAIAASEFKKRGKVLDTYSIDYVDNDKYFKASLFQPNSDQFYALKMADYIGSRHHSVINDNKALADALIESTIARDIPGMADVDSSLYLFCKEIRKDFVVGLSGECADELFGGYPWFTRPEMINADTFPWSRSVNERKTILSKGLKNIDLEDYTRVKYLETLGKVPHLDNESPIDYRMRELFYLNIKWFMVTLLNRKDRMSMANSLEVRVPFADYRIVQYAFNIPHAIKFADGREKGLLRRSLKGILPEEIIYRKKSPYPKTHNPLYTDYVCNWLKNIMNNPQSPLLSLIDVDKVKEIVDTKGESYKAPWYGQLMTGPQLIAYLIQVNLWLENLKVKIEL